MHNLKVLYAAFLVFLPLLLGAQEKDRGIWSAEVSATGGSSFDKSGEDIFSEQSHKHFSNSTGDFDATITYKLPKFQIKWGGGAGLSFKRTEKKAASVKVGKDNVDFNDLDFEDLSADYTQYEKYTTKYRGRIALAYTPSASDEITFGADYNYTFDDFENLNQGFSIQDVSGKGTYNESSEIGNFTKHSIKPRAGWRHVFSDPHRVLALNADWSYTNDNRYTIWDKGNSKFSYEDSGDISDIQAGEIIYRVTPKYIDSDFSFTARYDDARFCGVDGLKADFALLVKLDRDFDDYLAATLVEDFTTWRDSTRFNEEFDYLAMTLQPSAHVSYSTGCFDFDAALRLQYFTDRLNSTEQTERFDGGSFNPLFSLKASWRPAASHKITLALDNSIRRPDYLQLCWFQRPGSYLDELRQGNPDLNPASTYHGAFTYRFTKGRLSAGVELGDSYISGNIEETFRTEIVEEKSIRVITWVNAGHSNTSYAKFDARWSADRFKVGAAAGINYFRGVDLNENVTRNCDWNVSADASYRFPCEMTVLGRFRYQSKIIRSYSSMTDYYGLDLKISQPLLSKKMEIFLEGRDLLDKEIETDIYSLDGTDNRESIEVLNRRIILLGLKYSF